MIPIFFIESSCATGLSARVVMPRQCARENNQRQMKIKCGKLKAESRNLSPSAVKESAFFRLSRPRAASRKNFKLYYHPGLGAVARKDEIG